MPAVALLTVSIAWAEFYTTINISYYNECTQYTGYDIVGKIHND